MSHTYKLAVNIQELGETIPLEGSLGNEQWDLLEEFVSCVDELKQTRLVRNSMKSSFRMEGDDTGVVRVSWGLPPWEDVQAFLHVFRPILLQNEATNFHKVCNLICKQFDHPYVRRLVAFQREMYNVKKLQEQFEIKSEGVPLNSEEVLQQWLNSYEFHRNKKKKEFIDSLHQLLPLDASKAIFVSLLTEKARAAINIGMISRVILGKQRQVTGRVRRVEDR